MEGAKDFLIDWAMGGVTAAISKTLIAPIERVKLLLQTQHVNPALMAKGGYDGIGDCFQKVIKEEGVPALWRGNLANVIRYFPTQALNFAFKGQIKSIFNVPKDASYATKMAANIASGGFAGSLSLTVVYSLDFARTRLANDSKGE